MMGGGVCWLDYDNDGWLDLYRRQLVRRSSTLAAVAGARRPAAQRALPQRAGHVRRRAASDRGADLGAPRQRLRRSRLRRRRAHRPVRDRRSADDAPALERRGRHVHRRCREGRDHRDSAWHSGAAVGDVNGDGRARSLRRRLHRHERPDRDLESRASRPITAGVPRPSSTSTSVRADANGRAVPGGRRGWRESSRSSSHGLGAVFTDVNGDGRPDLYVANDEDPNRLYLNLPAQNELGFRLVDRAGVGGVADPNAGMGISTTDFTADGSSDLVVTNARKQLHAIFRADDTNRAGSRSSRMRDPTSPRRWTRDLPGGASRGSISTSTASSSSSSRTAGSRCLTFAATHSGFRSSLKATTRTRTSMSAVRTASDPGRLSTAEVWRRPTSTTTATPILRWVRSVASSSCCGRTEPTGTGSAWPRSRWKRERS